MTPDSSIPTVFEFDEEDEMCSAAARNSLAISSGCPLPSSNFLVSDSFRRPTDWGFRFAM